MWAFVTGLAIGLIVGTFAGMVLMALLTMAKISDEAMEREMRCSSSPPPKEWERCDGPWQLAS